MHANKKLCGESVKCFLFNLIKEIERNLLYSCHCHYIYHCLYWIGYVDWNKSTQCKCCEFSFIWEPYWELQPERGSLSALRNCLEEVREEPEYIWTLFAGNKKHVVKHEKVAANHKKKKPQTAEANDFSAFLCMGRYKSLRAFEMFS